MKIYQIISKLGTEYLEGDREQAITDYLAQYEDAKRSNIDVEELEVDGFLDYFGDIITDDDDLILTAAEEAYYELSLEEMKKKLEKNDFICGIEENFRLADWESFNPEARVLVVKHQLNDRNDREEIDKILKS